MIRWLLLAMVLCVPARAQPNLSVIIAGPSQGAAYTYSGPGDVVSGASAWYSVARAYSNAAALAGVNAMIVRAQVGTNAGNFTTVKVLNNGLVDGPAANAWGGIDVKSMSCTSAVNTLTCTGASSTPHTFDTFTGAGVTQPCWSTATGTFTGGAGTITTGGAGCGTIASPVTMVAQGGVFVSTLYDQTGGNACGSAACDLVQATNGDQPEWLPYCANGGTLPCLVTSAAAVKLVSANNFTPNAALEVSLVAVANEVVGTGSASLIQENGNNNYLEHRASIANSWSAVMGNAAGPIGTANDGVWHIGTTVGQAGASATIINIDGTETVGTRTPNNTAGTPSIAGAGSTTLLWSEGGFWDNLVFTPTQRTNQCGNAAAAYGVTPGGAC